MKPFANSLYLFALLLAGEMIGFLSAQEAGQFPANALYKGSENCVRCHSNAEPGRYPTDFVLLNEATAWEKHDKHSQAFRLLVGVTMDAEGTHINAKSLGLTMLKRLTGDELQDKFAKLEAVAAATSANSLATAKTPAELRQVTRPYLEAAVDLFLDPRSKVGFGCLTCHSNLKKEKTYENPEVEKSFREMFIVNAVSCEACHGPSDLWEGPHRERVVERKHLLAAELPVTPENGFELSWRQLTPEQKLKFGFVEVRNPAIRAQQCFSCHIGDREEGKFIPHQWYVAGHPPLPSIELSTFANDMPRHWRHLPEKGAFEKRTEFLQANGLTPAALHDSPETKAVLVGGVVAFRKAVELLASVHAEQSFLPNFAGFDCLSCHQELRNEPVLTRDRFDPLTPGRPGLPRWSTALVETSYDLLDPSGQAKDDFHRQYELLRAALGKRPFGDKKLVREACNKLLAELKERERELAKIIITPTHAQAAREALLNTAKSEPLDFHTARQIAWAIRRVDTEIASPAEFATKEGNTAAREFEAWLTGPRNSASEQITLRMNQNANMADNLSLRLPARQENSIERNLAEWPTRADRFQPLEFMNAAQRYAGEKQIQP